MSIDREHELLDHLERLQMELDKLNQKYEKATQKAHQGFWDKVALAACTGELSANRKYAPAPAESAKFIAEIADALVKERRERFEK